MKSFLWTVFGVVSGALIILLWIVPVQIDEKTELKKRIDRLEISNKITETQLTRKKREAEEEHQRWLRVIARDIEERIEKVGLPVSFEIRRYDTIGDEKDSDIAWIVDGLALPLYDGRERVGVFSLTFDPREATPGQGVFGPSEVDLEAGALDALKEEITAYLRERIEEGDRRIEISWVWTPEAGSFRTHAVIGKNGALKFESLLFFSPDSEDVQETVETRQGNTTLSWTGEVRNGLGLKAISWKAYVAYDWKDGQFLTKPAGKFHDLISFLPLWRIDHDETGGKPGTFREVAIGQNVVQLSQYSLSLGWRTGFSGPVKLKSAEFAGVDTGLSVLNRTYELAGDGTARALLP